MKTTTPHLRLVRESANQPDAQELQIIIHNFGMWEYKGTRAQLEAEGVVPDDIEWPAGARDLWFGEGKNRKRLSRTRPDGLKGPMRLWTSGDWWSLASLPAAKGELPDPQIVFRQRQLDQLVRERSNEALNGLWRARDDAGFQAFKAAIVPERRPPGRPPKQRSAQASTSAGG